jgi:hypothetical protein
MNDEIPTTEEQPTDTPRTDAWATYNGVTGIEYVYANVARRLELELSESKVELTSVQAANSQLARDAIALMRDRDEWMTRALVASGREAQ